MMGFKLRRERISGLERRFKGLALLVGAFYVETCRSVVVFVFLFFYSVSSVNLFSRPVH